MLLLLKPIRKQKLGGNMLLSLVGLGAPKELLVGNELTLVPESVYKYSIETANKDLHHG